MEDIITITGPTATGKTNLAVEIALRLDAEIISVDSRQIYRHFPIAAAVPAPEERNGITHHFIEELNPDEEYNAGRFGKDARGRIDDIFSRGKKVVIVGGSGLYLRSLTEGFFEDEIDTTKERKKLYNVLREKGKEFLYNELKAIDKLTASNLTPSNIRRVIRALEIYYASGRKISEVRKSKPEINFNPVKFGLTMKREELYERINNRVDEMMKKGLVDEIRTLLDNGYHYKTHNSLNTVGVKEVIQFIEGELTKAEMSELIKMNTRRYAKRQMTWFRKEKDIKWIDLSENRDRSKITDYILNYKTTG